MTRRTAGIAGGALIVASVAGWWFSSRDRGSREAADAQSDAGAGDTSAHRVSYASTPDRAPAWFGQPGVAARRVAGLVTFDGRPVAGAEVRLWSDLAEAGIETEPVATTNDRGEFDFGHRVAASYTLSATAPDREPALIGIDLRDPAPDMAPDALRLELRACTARVYGTTRDASAGTIAGTTLRMRYNGAIVLAEAGDDGTYEACVRPGELTVEAMAEGYGRVYADVTVLTRVRRDFDLVPAAALRGRVEHAGEPVAGAQITVWGDRRGGSTRKVSTVSQPDGRFVVDQLTPGRYSVRATAQGLESPPIGAVAAVGDSGGEFTCELSATYALAGTVTMDGEPVGGIWLSASGTNKHGSGDAVSQNDGRFAIANLPPDRYRMYTFEHTIVSGQSVEIDDADQSLSVEVTALGVVTGTVVGNGSPIAGAAVYTRGARTRSKSDGTFRLAGLPAGSHEIGAESTRAGAFNRGVRVEVVEGQIVEGVEIELDLAASIAGTVVDQTGAPVAEAHLVFSLKGGRDYGFAQTRADGSFIARGMSGGGTYDVEIRPGPRSPLAYPPAGDSFETVDLVDGQSHATDIAYTVHRDPSSVTGRVERVSGAPVPDARVILLPMENRAQHSGYDSHDEIATTTRADGTFAFATIQRGAYKLKVSASEGAARILDVTAPADDVVVRLPDVGRIEGTLSGFTEDVTVHTQGASRETYATRGLVAQVQGDSLSIDAVPAGSYIVSARGTMEAASAEVEVRAGETSTIELVNPGTARVIGTIADFATRRPLAGYQCNWQLARSAGGGGITVDPTLATGDDGRFELAIPAAPVLVSCHNTSWSGERARRETLPTLRIELSPGERLERTLYRVEKSTIEQADTGMFANDGEGGARVATVKPGSAAERAGLRVGDLIVAVDGVGVRDIHFFGISFLIDDKLSTGRVVLTVERGSESLELELEIEPRTYGR